MAAVLALQGIEGCSLVAKGAARPHVVAKG
jgi:hypothetical protein